MKRLLACALSVTVCGVFFAACGASASSVCEKTCDCVGCSDEERDECIDQIEDAEREADAEGCSQEYANALDCYAEEMECESSGRIEVTGCDDVIEELTDCMGSTVIVGGSDCVSVCEEAKGCEGADPSVDCEQNCADAEQQVAAAGCSAEYDDLLACAAAGDVCAISCDAEANAYVDCFSGGT